MDNDYRRRLERNVVKYAWFKVFNKRVFLPLIAIHLVNVGHVTVGQLAFIAGVVSVVQLLLQMPSGYIADRWGNRPAIIIGSAIASLSPLFYIFMPNFTGGLLAAVLFFGGYTFQSGAIEAFMHDTLLALGKERQYARVLGRAQSYGLIGNLVLMILIPATYPLNQNLPFFLGFLSLLAMLWLACSFTYPPHRGDGSQRNPFRAARSVVTAQNIALFLFAGAMGGVAYRSPEFRELVFQDVGIAVGLFGALIALSHLVGAVMGRYIHLLDRLRPLSFYMFDLCLMAGCLVLIGLSRSVLPVVIGFTLFAGYVRVRLIVFQSKLLGTTDHIYKATLLSALNLFSIFGEIAAIALLSRLVGFRGYTGGYLLFGLAVFGVGLALWLVMAAERRYNLGRK